MNSKQSSIAITALIAASILGIVGIVTVDGSPLALQKAIAVMCSKCDFGDDEGECFGPGC